MATSALATPTRLPSLGFFDVSILGLSATIDPLEPTVPKNTASALRIVVRAGDKQISRAELAGYLGGDFDVHGELTGPGLCRAVTLPILGPSDPPPDDPLLLALPPLDTAGDYLLSNIRIEQSGRPLIDAAPASIPIKVIDQILVTSVTTRALTLDEIKEKGIVLDSDDYTGFEFTLGLATSSQTVSFSIPVVFDREGVAVPQVITPPPSPSITGIRLGDDPLPPLIIPGLLETPEELADIPEKQLKLPNGDPIRIPSVLVIPGNVGYLKQFFSAQLFVANGAPVGSGLTVRDVTGTVKMPPGADLVVGTDDDPLALPETVRGLQPTTMPVKGVGLDGAPATADDVDVLKPAEQGQAEFLLRGEKEGFHSLSFDINAILDGLPIGPIPVMGKAVGGVLVRNPFFDMTFTVPSVVRKGESFSLYATVHNIGQGMANDVHVTLDASRISGATLVGEGTQIIDTLRTGDARTLEYKFVSQRTGQVVATYLNFDSAAAGGTLKFTLGVGERGVALSPDTLVLPSAVDSLPPSVVDAAMRVIGQAWSIANAPTGTLPMDVIRVNRTTANAKVLALSEAGLRALLGQATRDAVRDLAVDFYGPPLDPGFDQLMRETAAGQDFARAVGAALVPAVTSDGGVLPWGHSVDRVATSGGDFLRFGVGMRAGGAPVELSVVDGYGQRTAASSLIGAVATAEIPGAFWLPLSDAGATFLVTALDATRYTLEVSTSGAATLDFSVTTPRGGGRFIRTEASGVNVIAGSRIRILLDLYQPDQINLETDFDGDGTFESVQAIAVAELAPEGPNLLSATIVGPETLDGASPFGTHAAALFDRVVEPTSASNLGNYVIPKNQLLSARSQLSGRFVFLSLSQPEGPYIPTSLQVSGIRDARGTVGATKQVDFGCRLEDPGAVISGRVIGPNGEPLTAGTVTYQGNSNWQCKDDVAGESGLAAVALDAAGRYEFRYVRRDLCGYPWVMLTNDPATGALRQVTGYVDHAGEQIVVDIAMLGQGEVTGIVRDLSGKPVPLAQVVAVSQTDPQVGGKATSDGDGRYEIYGITVGPVSVTAVKGSGVGHAAGSIARAGSTAEVNVTLDSGAASLAGRVLIEEGSSVRAVPGLNVVFKIGDVPIAVVQTDAQGAYRFDSIPAGAYHLEATLNMRDQARVSGSIAGGDTLTNVDLVIVVPVAGDTTSSGLGYGTVQGTARYPNGDPASGVIVSIEGRGLLSADDGSFEITGVPVKPGQAQTVAAQSRDGLRSGSAVAYVNQRNQVVSGIVVVLSGLGQAQFTLLSASGTPVVGQQVALLDRCEGECGCSPETTDANGKVTFTNLPIGTVQVRAVRQGSSFVDVVDGNATITRDGETGVATMRFAGSGTVAGTVRDEKGQPIYGADVVLQARMFNAEYCALGSGIAQRVRTNTAGGYRFQAVNVGPVSVTASQTFYPTPVGRSATLTQQGEEVTLDLVLSSVSNMAGELSGTVYMPNGTSPVGAGVEVTVAGVLPDVVVNTDALGHYRFAKILPLGNYQLTARDPITGGVARSSISLQAGQDLEANLRLLGKGTVLVHVVDANDAAVSEAYVRLYETGFPNRQFEGAADAANRGLVRFDNVFEGGVSAEVSDVYGRGGRASSYLSGDAATLELKVRLSITGTVTGRFVQADNTTPVPFGSVALYAGGRLLGQSTTVGAGADVGRFTFEHVPAGPVRVEARDPATGRTGVAVGTVNTQDQVVDLLVRSQGLGTVEGVVTSNGQPTPGADVVMVAGSLRAETTADPAGHYRFTGVPEGSVALTANLGNGYLMGSASANLVGDGTVLTLDVALRDSGAVGGVVLKADGVTVAPSSRVTLTVGGTGGGTLSTLTDALGHFQFDRVPAGTAAVTVDVLGSIDQAALTTTVPAGGTLLLEVRLHGVGSLRGIAYDSSGRRAAGSVVIAGTGDLKYSQSVAAAADGTFAIPELLAGPFTASLALQTSTFLLYGSAQGEIKAGQETQLEIRVQETGIVRGCAMRSDNATPALGAEVVLSLVPNRGSYGLYAGSDGCFEAIGVPLGAFALKIRDAFTGGLAQIDGNNIASNGQVVDVGRIVLDDTPVEAIAFEPADGAMQVAIQQPIRVTFSDRLASAQGITISNGTQALYTSTSVTSDGLTAILNGTWTDSAEITVTATTAVTDQFGRHPKAAKSARFRTVDLSPPQVVAVTPPNGAIEVSANPTIVVEFNEPLSAQTNLAALVTLTGPSGTILGTTLTAAANRVEFTPAAALADNGSFTVSINGALDASGNRQTVAKTSQFATRDTVAPVLVLKQPAVGSWSSSATPTIVVGLSDNLSGIDATTGELTIDTTAVEPARTTTELRYVPTQALTEGRHTIEASVLDRAGNPGELQAELKVDTVPPSMPVMAGVTNGAVLLGTLALSATATDTGSGVARIVITSDGTDVLALETPLFAGSLNTATLSEGRHALSAHAVDTAGNRGPDAPSVNIVVNNRPIVVSITAPPEGTRTRNGVTVTATVSEPVDRVEFSILRQGIPDESIKVIDSTLPYAATLDLLSVAEGDVSLVATAFDSIGGSGTGSRGIVIDRTPPATPNALAIFAEPPDNGLSLVHGDGGSVEAGAQVVATNLTTGLFASGIADKAGAFALNLRGTVGDSVTLVATDVAGNSSGAATIQIRVTTTLPPAQATLRFEGVLVDRVGAGAPGLEPDGKRDAVFSLEFDQGASITRQLAFVDLEGPTTRSTRLEVASVLGVAATDLSGAWLNHADGQVDSSLSGKASLVLIAPAGGWLVAGTTYRATAAFTNGSRFVGSLAMPTLPQEEASTAAFSVRNDELPVPPGGPIAGLLPQEVASPTVSVANQSLPYDVVTNPGQVQATEVASGTISTFNQFVPYDPRTNPTQMLAAETTSVTTSVMNQWLPYATEGEHAEMLASEVAGNPMSIFNQYLPFDLVATPQAALATEVAGPTMSLRNDWLPFSESVRLATESSSGTLSVNNDPNSTPTPAPTAGSLAALFANPTAAMGAAPGESSAVGGLVGTAGVVSTITGPTVSVRDVEAFENSGVVEVAVELSAPSAVPVTVNYATKRITATAASEYAEQSGTIELAPGSTRELIRMAIYDDTLHESDETFELELSNPENAVLEQSEATVTLLDDDPRSPLRPWLFDDFESSRLADSTWTQVVEGRTVPNAGTLTLAGAAIESTSTFASEAEGAAAQARLRLMEPGQRFGFNLFGSARGLAGYFVGTGSTGKGVKAVVELSDEQGVRQQLLNVEVAINRGEFSDFAIELRDNLLRFLVDGFEVARVTLSLSTQLPIGLYSERSDQPLAVDWVEVRSATATQTACIAPQQGMIAWWPAEGTARDVVSGRVGVLERGAAFAPGRVGQAFLLDGLDDAIWIESSEKLAPAELTLAAWVKPSSFGPDGWLSTLVAKQAVGTPATGDGSEAASFALQIDSTGTPQLALYDGHLVSRVAGTVQLSLGAWHHVAATRQANQVRLYLDGQNIGQGNFVGDIFYNDATGFDVELGSYLRQGASQALEGLLDEVTVFERALSTQEIQAVYASGSAGYCLP